MFVDVWPEEQLTDSLLKAYKEADETKAISIHEVVWRRSTRTAMVSYRTEMSEDEAHDMLRNLSERSNT